MEMSTGKNTGVKWRAHPKQKDIMRHVEAYCLKAHTKRNQSVEVQ